jgi:hypothetical protein
MTSSQRGLGRSALPIVMPETRLRVIRHLPSITAKTPDKAQALFRGGYNAEDQKDG